MSEVLKVAQPLLFDAAKKEGVILPSHQKLRRNELAYMVISRSRDRALELEAKFFELLGGL